MISRKTPIVFPFPRRIVLDLWATRIKHYGPFVITWERLRNGESLWARLWIGW